jgi:pimeloyl-ACP methyl ester carboxylesterase
MPIEIHEIRIPTPGPDGQPWEIAATVFLPPPLSLASGPNVLVLLPGGGYGRGYFNLPVPGTSQAMYHAGRGNIIVAIDPLGVGDSSPAEDASAADGAAAVNAVATHIKRALPAGTFVPGLGPVAFGAITAAGQSLGGHLLAVTQAEHDTFVGIALLGSSVAGTQFPLPGGGVTTAVQDADFSYVFHWGDVPQVDATAEPTDLETLIGVDVALGVPVRTADAPWSSRTVPGATMDILAAATARAGEITRPVLLAAGERDVTQPLEAEAAMFTGSPEVDTFVLPESAHMHNFAATREQLWKRLDTFVHHSATFGRRVQSTEFVAAMIAAASAAASAEEE